MAFVSITKPSVGDPTRKDLIDDIIDNLDDLDARVGSGGSSGLSNPSFESFTTNDPSSWTVTETGGTQTIEDDDNTEQAHGAAALKITYPASASGGGYFETSDFYACAPNQILKIAWRMLLASSDGAKNIVRFYWYKYDQSASATASTDAYSDTGAPTTWQQFYTEAQAPSDAKYFKVRFIASDTSATPSGPGSVSFDDVRLVQGPEEVFNNHVTFGLVPGEQFDNANDPAWESPSSVGACWVECIGGGGGGGSAANSGAGGGGAYAAGYFVYAASTQYNCQAGAPGAVATAGGDSTFNSTSIVAKGGEGSEGTNDPGEGGAAGSCTGEITISGGDGSGQQYGGYGARGGGGARSPGASGGTAASWPGGGGGGDMYTSYDAVAAAGMVKIWFNS